jgi:hypothetical protein
VALYLMNDAAFALPGAGVVDRTVTVVDATADDGVLHTILVHRSAMPAGKALADLAAENLRDAALRLPEHAVLFARPTEVAGAPAIEQAARWRGREGVVYTRVAHLAVRGAWLVVATTAAIDDRAGSDAVMDHLLGTFRLRP